MSSKRKSANALSRPAFLMCAMALATIAARNPQSSSAAPACVAGFQSAGSNVVSAPNAGMRETISNSAELGATLGGPRIVDAGVRQRMAEVLAEIRAGKFAQELTREEADGYPRLEAARAKARELPVEQAFRSLRTDGG